MGPGVPRRADDGGAAGPLHAPMPHLRDERRKLSLPRVDENEEGQRRQTEQMTPLQSPPALPFSKPIVFPVVMPITSILTARSTTNDLGSLRMLFKTRAATTRICSNIFLSRETCMCEDVGWLTSRSARLEVGTYASSVGRRATW